MKMNKKTILILASSLVALILALRMSKKKRKKPKNGKKGLKNSKMVRTINSKQKKRIPLTYQERVFLWTYSHAKNNPKGKEFSFFEPYAFGSQRPKPSDK